MKNKPKRGKPSDASQPKPLMVKISEGQFDTDSPTVGAADSPHGTGTPTSDADADKLQLPGGGLVAMRKSGGLRFTSREVIVYADGRVATDGGPAPTSTQPASTRRLSDKDLVELHQALKGANLHELPHTSGQQNPDAFAYEITARIGAGGYSLEVFDGSIPKQLAPLVALLTKLMRTSGW